MDSYTVYMHTFPNGKRYVGITCLTASNRWRKGQGYEKQPVYNAINKYGWDNILHEILFTGLSKEDAEIKERQLISIYHTNIHENGYNVELGGYHNGKTTKETREKISNSCKGKKHRFAKRKPKNQKPVICIETGETFPCAKDAQIIMGIDANNIKHCCNHHKYYKTAGGYHWEFLRR